MYLVYLGLPRPETHTTGAAAAGAALATIGAAAGARTGSSGSGTSSSLASAAGATLLAHDARSGLGLAAGGIAACLPRHCAPSDVKLILVLLPQYTLYLCIWLCIWCVSASKTETHRYTRIRTPHPVYLTSRVGTPRQVYSRRRPCNTFVKGAEVPIFQGIFQNNEISPGNLYSKRIARNS